MICPLTLFCFTMKSLKFIIVHLDVSGINVLKEKRLWIWWCMPFPSASRMQQGVFRWLDMIGIDPQIMSKNKDFWTTTYSLGYFLVRTGANVIHKDCATYGNLFLTLFDHAYFLYVMKCSNRFDKKNKTRAISNTHINWNTQAPPPTKYAFET